MKFFYSILVCIVLISSCNDTETNVGVESDSAKAFATADSMAAAKALADTIVGLIDSTHPTIK